MTTAANPTTFEELLGKLYADRAAVDALVDQRPGLIDVKPFVALLTAAGYSRQSAVSTGRQLADDKIVIRDALSNIYDALDRIRTALRHGIDAQQNRGRQ